MSLNKIKDKEINKSMRKTLRLVVLSFIVSGAVLFAGCSKESGCKSVPVDDEKTTLENFNTSIGMNATRHPSGVYYEIIEPGSNNKPILASTLYVKYKGTLLNGTVFDQQTNPGLTGFILNNLIDGWKNTVPMIGKGGKIRISVPSALGYGCQGQPSGTVPIEPNTPLYFEIDLVDFF
jgi:FKBP-type peptidyl-prolyl cis-trans isomerase